jgi:dihydroorotate dehydrogenase
MESPTLTLEEIKGNLCYYDAENPNNNLDCYDDEEERPKPRENCHCDNCFYGRDKLARYILSNRLVRLGVWFRNLRNRKTARAYRDLTRAMQKDADYAHTWQCNIACPLMDEGMQPPHEAPL